MSESTNSGDYCVRRGEGGDGTGLSLGNRTAASQPGRGAMVGRTNASVPLQDEDEVGMGAPHPQGWRRARIQVPILWAPGASGSLATTSSLLQRRAVLFRFWTSVPVSGQ